MYFLSKQEFQELFKKMLKSHELEFDVLGARYGEENGTTRGHYAEFAVALTNLLIHAGIEQPVVDPFIPQGLV
ncbi:hypothetical protein [Shewanella algae]|uniref:hypothetical protein n=2 Tax=Shewanella algae TaxID=38313 RepID=UPI0011820191|nr:hypothetical protein [Shewanella algae]